MDAALRLDSYNNYTPPFNFNDSLTIENTDATTDKISGEEQVVSTAVQTEEEIHEPLKSQIENIDSRKDEFMFETTDTIFNVLNRIVKKSSDETLVLAEVSRKVEMELITISKLARYFGRNKNKRSEKLEQDSARSYPILMPHPLDEYQQIVIWNDNEYKQMRKCIKNYGDLVWRLRGNLPKICNVQLQFLANRVETKTEEQTETKELS